MGESGGGGTIRVASMDEHVSRAISDTLLNTLWREQLMAEGYQGAADLMSRLQNVFDTQCVCGGIPDQQRTDFDSVSRTGATAAGLHFLSTSDIETENCLF